MRLTRISPAQPRHLPARRTGFTWADLRVDRSGGRMGAPEADLRPDTVAAVAVDTASGGTRVLHLPAPAVAGIPAPRRSGT
jgi:hypothetical protein